MKIELEIRSTMSRPETFRALNIALDACARLAHRMTPAELQRLENFAAALAALADDEMMRRGPQRLTAPATAPIVLDAAPG